MHRVIRIAAIVLLVFTLFSCASIHCAAIADEPMQEMQQAAADLDIPQEAEDALDDLAIDATDPQGMLSLSPESVFRKLRQTAADEAAAPLRLCGSLLALTVLATLLGGLTDAAAESALRRIYDALCTVICVTVAAKPLCGCLLRTAAALDRSQLFMASFVPVFAAFLAAGGSIAGSASYQAFVLFLTEIIMQLTNGMLLPLLQMSTALGIADAVNPQLRLEKLAGGLRTAVTWILGTMMALFSALLSVRTFVASAADSLAAKSVRLLTAGMIPIVGSAVSDAYGTVQGSIRLLRNGTGAVGIIVIILLTVPPLLSLLLHRAVFWLMQVFADMAGAESLAKLYRNMQAVLSASFAMLVCCAVMLIFSSAIMILLTGAS